MELSTKTSQLNKAILTSGLVKVSEINQSKRSRSRSRSTEKRALMEQKYLEAYQQLKQEEREIEQIEQLASYNQKNIPNLALGKKL